MQDCHRQLNRLQQYWALFFIVVTAPIVVYGLLSLLPTFDDWTYLASPYFGNLSDIIIPVGNYWRPFDACIGAVLGLNYHWFPSLNHLIIWPAHAISAYLVFRLCRFLGFRYSISNLATLFFYLSPGMLGTVLSIDSINQTYAHFWGLLGLWLFLIHKKGLQILFFIGCCYLATLSKENGIMWFVIIPVFAYGFGYIDKKHLLRVAGYAAVAITIYFIIRLSLPVNPLYQNEAYFDSSILHFVKNVSKFILLTFLPADYVAWFIKAPVAKLIFFLTVLLSLPLMTLIIGRQVAHWKDKKLFTLFFCMLMAVLPHLLTLFTVMHVYASLSLFSLSIGYVLNEYKHKKYLTYSFAAFVLSALISDIHHTQAAYQSGKTAEKMGQQAAKMLPYPVKKVYSITIKEDYSGYSSFLVVPSHAFGWGSAAIHQLGYKYPSEWKDTTIQHSQVCDMPAIVNQAVKNGYEKVFLFDGENIRLIK